jgi:hypothetical protein
MSTSFGGRWQDCKEKGQRFFAEFTWEGLHDHFAENRFKKWDTDLFENHATTPPKPRWDTICKDNTQAYYLVGTRTFWIISCAKNEAEVILFCDFVSDRKVSGEKIKYSYYQCLKPGEPGAPTKLKPK